MAAHFDKYSRRKSRTSYISTVIGISVVLFMLGLAGLLLLSAKTIENKVKEQIQLDIYFKESANEAEIRQVEKTLKAEPYVLSATYVSKDSALTTLKDELGEDALDILGTNPLDASINLFLVSEYAHIDSVKNFEEWLISDYEKLIREVHYNPVQFMEVNKWVGKVTLGLLIFSGILLIVAIALINNTIRLAIYSKRFLIKTMQLVGATHGFIRRPFMANAFAQGILAGLIAIGLLMGTGYLIKSYFPDFILLIDLKLFLTLFVMIIAGGIIISWVSTYFAVRKFIRIKSDQLY